MRAAFHEKLGREFRPYLILGACNPPLAFSAINADPTVGLLLPCNVTVESIGDQRTVVRLTNPEALLATAALGTSPSLQTSLEQMEARLRYIVPLTLVLVVGLLYLSMRGWPQTWLVLSSLPFAVAGSVWLLDFMDYNLSTAVWVGLIAVAGVAAETGIVMVVYLDEAFNRYTREGRIQKPEDVDAAVVEGASTRVRPLVMTVATTVLGLLPLLWESGVGADVSARTAAPVVGGLWSCMLLTLLVLPAAYAMWRRHQVRVGASVPLLRDGGQTDGGCIRVKRAAPLSCVSSWN